MNRFFIFPESFYFNIFLVIFSLIFLPGFVSVVYFLFFTFYLYIFRRRNIYFEDAQGITNNLILSPMDGIIKEIYPNIIDTQDLNNKTWVIIQIHNRTLDSHGIYFPFISEVDYIFASGESTIWQRARHFLLTNKLLNNAQFINYILKNRNKQTIKLLFPKLIMGHEPRFWAKSGDRGRTASCLGYLPWGGVILVAVPFDSDILVKKDEIVSAGETILVRLKG
jgi:hypothetical protein